MLFDSKSLHLEANFDDFLQNNNVFMQGNRTFKKISGMEKVHILTIRLDFFNFQQNNSVFVAPPPRKKKGAGISKYEPRGKFIFRLLVVNFAIFCRIITYPIFPNISREFCRDFTKLK